MDGSTTTDLTRNIVMNTETEVELLKRDVESLTEQVKQLTASTQELADAWKAASTLIGFIKLLAAISVSIGVIITAIKGGIDFERGIK